MEEPAKVLLSARASRNLYLSILWFIIQEHPERERVTARIRGLVESYDTDPPTDIPANVVAQMESQGLNFLRGLS